VSPSRLTLALAAAGLLACGGAQPPAQPEVARHGWLEVRSPHFTLATDLPWEAAEAAARRLEERYVALAHVYARLVTSGSLPARRAELVVFADCGDLPRPGGGVVLGYVDTTLDFRDEHRIVTCGHSAYADETMLHELAHVLNAHLVGPMPVWLNEGLAKYAQTLTIEGGEVLIGRIWGGPTAFLEKHANPLALDELFGADRATFYGAQSTFYYHAAHNLVHVLVDVHEPHQQRFIDYLARLAAGEARAQAWQAALGAVPAHLLEQEMRAHHLKPEHQLWRLPLPDAPPAGVATRRLGAGETAALRVSLSLGHRRAAPEAQLALLEDGARADPAWPDLALWRALVELARPVPDREAGLRLLGEHLRRRPDDERALSGILRTASGALGDELGADPAALAQLDAVAARLARVARSAAALNGAAWFYAQRRQPQRGLPLAERAVALRPTHPDLLDTLAALLAQVGRVDEALALQERAVQSYGERATPGMLRRLAQLREATAR
jgi:hypothetical protein